MYNIKNTLHRKRGDGFIAFLQVSSPSGGWGPTLPAEIWISGHAWVWGPDEPVWLTMVSEHSASPCLYMVSTQLRGGVAVVLHVWLTFPCHFDFMMT